MGQRKTDGECTGVHDSINYKYWGFTLVELLASIAILAILAGIAIPTYVRYIEKARIAKAITELKDISAAVESYRADNNDLPASLNDVGYQNFLDPWENPYEYYNIVKNGPGGAKQNPPDQINTDYDLYSKGSDGGTHKNINNKKSEDDIIRADEGSYIGPVSKY